MSNTDEQQRSEAIRWAMMADGVFIDPFLQRWSVRLARAESEPQGIELVKQLRDALGLHDVAPPESPQVVWEETLDVVRRMRAKLPRYTDATVELGRRAAIARDELSKIGGPHYLREDYHGILVRIGTLRRAKAVIENQSAAIIDMLEGQPEEATGPTRAAEVDALLPEQIGAAQAGEEAEQREIARKVERLERAVANLSPACKCMNMDPECPVGEIAREVAQR